MVAATKTAVPPLNGGTCDHDSEANHALTVANGSTWMACSRRGPQRSEDTPPAKC
jgi:hypothetical protein